MRKTTKLLAVILALITLMSSFSIISGAISSKSSAKELLNYYEDCIIRISAKEDIIKAENTYKSKEVADYSTLKGEDLEATKAENEEWEVYTGKWNSYTDAAYYHCDAFEDWYWEGRSEFIDYFSIKRDIRRYELKFKSAKYAKADNGDVTLTFVYVCDFDDGNTETITYKAVINKNGTPKSYTRKAVGAYEMESVDCNAYKVNYEAVDTYKYVYNKVDAESIDVSSKNIVLGKEEEYILAVKVNPKNATYKDFYIDDVNLDWDIADWYEDENGNVHVYAVGPGTTTFNICTYSGDVVETVEVTVEFTFFERIIYFFENIGNGITEFFEGALEDFIWYIEDLFYTDDYEDEFYEEEYIEDEEGFICGTEF